MYVKLVEKIYSFFGLTLILVKNYYDCKRSNKYLFSLLEMIYTLEIDYEKIITTSACLDFQLGTFAQELNADVTVNYEQLQYGIKR